MKVAVIQFPGSNCDRDCVGALTRAGLDPQLVWYQETSLAGFKAVVLPGGFSYGDYLRPGAIASRDPVLKEVARLAKQGYPVLGICNGFQILTEARLLPGALLRNTTLRFICKPTEVLVTAGHTPFTRGLNAKSFNLPVAHMDGGYYVDDDTLKLLQDRDQIAFRYFHNPNGSVDKIAGVCNDAGNVVGMMPHPERVSDPMLGSDEGLAIFQAML